MERPDRRRLRQALPTLERWAVDATRVREARTALVEQIAAGRGRLQAALIGVERLGGPGWQVLPLSRADLDDAALMASRRAALPPLTDIEQGWLDVLAGLGEGCQVARRMTGWRRWVTSRKRRAAAEHQLGALLSHHDWGARHDADAAIARWMPGQLAAPIALDAEGLTELLRGQRVPEAALRPVSVAGELHRAIADLDRGVAMEAPLRERVAAAVHVLREPTVRQRLADQPIEDLAKVSTERMRIDLLRAAGIVSVADLQGSPRGRITEIQGIGARTAKAVWTAAQELERLAYAEAPVRLDPDQPTPQCTELITALVAWDAARVTRGAGDDLRRADALRELATRLRDDVTTLLVVPAGEWKAVDLEQEVLAVVRRADRVAAAIGEAVVAAEPDVPADPWAELARRPADFYSALAEAGVGTEQRVLGDLPAGLVQTVEAQELRTDHLRVTLRTYQAFAARFALVQRRVIIGDEMGLGKTIEALAVIAHLWSTGAQRFLVVCPASVVTNWVREVAAKSVLPVHRVHGDGLEDAFDAWRREGGVAVISFASLGWNERRFARAEGLDCVVVDEAHFIKNPETWRARAVCDQLARADRALLLTGTPMENRVDEFRTLLGYLRPDLVAGSEDLAPWPFRQRVAPAYLRRNVDDVLTELPELVETDDWLEMSDVDRAAYEAEVREGNFAAMRRAAILQGAASAKVQRLVELVEEAEENDRRVVVFSYFRDVLDVLSEHLVGERVEPVFGPLTGSITPDARQSVIDQFSAAERGAVLLVQITTGGVGVNIQAASVVIICEPQLKHTTEAQAIARAHRMGQLRSVQVHRLLSEDSVDERIVEILAAKRKAFDDYVRSSELADAAPNAREFSDADLAREVVAAERERLLYQPPEVVTPDD